MKVYIAGRMTGVPEWNFPAFHAAAADWRAHGWEVVNPAEAFDGATDRPYREYVAHDVGVLRSCDAIAMLPGWDDADARGSVWEHEIARQLLAVPVYNAVPAIPCTGAHPEAENSPETAPKSLQDNAVHRAQPSALPCPSEYVNAQTDREHE